MLTLSLMPASLAVSFLLFFYDIVLSIKTRSGFSACLLLFACLWFYSSWREQFKFNNGCSIPSLFYQPVDRQSHLSKSFHGEEPGAFLNDVGTPSRGSKNWAVAESIWNLMSGTV